MQFIGSFFSITKSRNQSSQIAEQSQGRQHSLSCQQPHFRYSVEWRSNIFVTPLVAPPNSIPGCLSLGCSKEFTTTTPMLTLFLIDLLSWPNVPRLPCSARDLLVRSLSVLFLEVLGKPGYRGMGSPGGALSAVVERRTTIITWVLFSVQGYPASFAL